MAYGTIPGKCRVAGMLVNRLRKSGKDGDQMKKYRTALGWRCLLMLLLACLLTAGAVAEGEMRREVVLEQNTVGQENGIGKDNEQLLNGYINRLFHPVGTAENDNIQTGLRLTGANLKIYKILRSLVEKVAAGEIARPECSFDPVEILGQSRWTMEDLGFYGLAEEEGIPEEAFDVLSKIVEESINIGQVVSALMVDCPYEMYWYNKADGGGIKFGYSLDCDYGAIALSSLYVTFAVAQEYASAYDAACVDSTLVKTAQSAAENAQSIVRKNSDKGDHEKLEAYRKAICNLVSYNDSAAAGRMAYGNPWQLVWVFDEDPDTNVVCEGYAKAFSYLCSRSSFNSGRINCATVAGYLGGEGHMWNIVTDENGERFLVDVTNCDEGCAGAPNLLFMVSPVSGNAADGYVFQCGGYELTYQYYYNSLLEIYTEEELTLGKAVTPPEEPEEETYVTLDIAHFPDANFLQYIRDAGFDADGDGRLSDTEMSNVTRIDCADMFISDLTGIGYFTSLTELNCSYNPLTSLDPSGYAALVYLNCDGCGLTKLDVSKNTELVDLYCDYNELTSLDVTNNQRLKTLVFTANQLTEIDLSNNPELETLYFDYNQIVRFDLSKNRKLRSLGFADGPVTSLDISQNTALEELYCGRNRLTELDLSKNKKLRDIWCDYNQLTELNLSNNQALEYLHCHGNQLKKLNLSKNTKLVYLWCHENDFSALDLSKCPSLVETLQTCTPVLYDGFRAYGEKPDGEPMICIDRKVRIKIGSSYIEPEEEKVVPTGVKLNKTKATLVAGKKLTLKVTLTPSDAETTLTWKSSNNKVAKVSQKGVVTAVKNGTATITVTTDNGLEASCKITVKLPAATKVTLSKKGTVKLTVGKTLTLTATVTPKLASQKVTWTSSNKKVATVNSKGKVTAKKAGTVTITAKTANGKKATVKIRVVKASANDLDLPEGD